MLYNETKVWYSVTNIDLKYSQIHLRHDYSYRISTNPLNANHNKTRHLSAFVICLYV